MTTVWSRLAAARHQVRTQTRFLCQALALVAFVFGAASPSFAWISTRAPTVTGVAPTTVAAGQAYSFTPVVTSASRFSFSIQNRPAWATFNSATGQLSGIPQSANVGTSAPIRIQVQNRYGSASLRPFSIAVTGTAVTSTATAPPTIGGAPLTTVQALATYSFTPVAASPRGAILSFSVQNLPSWATFNAVTGQITGSPGTADVGVFANIVVSVNDGTATASLAPFAVTVTAAPPPTITGAPAATVTALAAYTFTPAASSPRGAILSFSVQNLPSWATFNATTGQVWGTPSTANIGSFANITIVVSDGTGTATLAPFTIKVNPVPPPTISGAAATSVVVGQVYTFTPTTTNPSGGTLSFSIVNQPTWASFNTTTGQLSGTPTASDVGTVANIVISVSDGISSASLAGFTIVVQSATTGSATVGVVAPTTRTDGTPLTNLSGYHIYYGTTPGVYTNVITVTDPTITSYVVTNLPAGATYYFAATAYDADGTESGDSVEGSKTI